MRPMNVIEKRLSKVRQVEKECNKLYSAKCNLALIPLDKPIRHGWYREYVLRDDIARRKDAHVFLEILDACGSSEWGRTKREIEEQWERVTWSKDYWQWPGFRRIGKRAYRRLSVRAKKYFGHYEVRWNPWQGSVRRYHCHVPEYYFIPKYTKAYVTHLQSVDSEIDSKISRLENQLLSDELYPYSWWAANGLTNKFMRKWEIRNERRMTKIALQQYDEECYDRWAYKKVSY